MPSLTLIGTTRMQIEGVRVDKQHRGQRIGEWMLNQCLDIARKNTVKLIQLSTNKQRLKAKNFYEKFGFKATHEGMKLSL